MTKTKTFLLISLRHRVQFYQCLQTKYKIQKINTFVLLAMALIDQIIKATYHYYSKNISGF